MRFIAYVFWNRRERRLRGFWRLSFHLFATLVAVIGLVLPLFAVFQLLNLPVDNNEAILLFGGSAQAIAVLLAVLACCQWPDRRRVREIGLRGFRWIDFSNGFLVGAGFIVAIFAVEYSSGRLEIVRVGKPPDFAAASWIGIQIAWLVLMILVGTSEEMFSRGYHLKNMAESSRGLGLVGSVLVAALGSSVFFGLLHAFNDHATAVSTASVVLAGLTLAVVRLSTGNLAAPIGLHISWNYFQGPLLGFSVSGNAIPTSLVEIRHSGPAWITGGGFGPEAGVLGWMSCLLIILFFPLAPRLGGGRMGRVLARHTLALVRYAPGKRHHEPVPRSH